MRFPKLLPLVIGANVLVAYTYEVQVLAEERAVGRRAEVREQSQDVQGVGIQEAMKALALVSVLLKSGYEVRACGPVINSDGAILTNYHVIENAQKILVNLYDEETGSWNGARAYEAKVVKSSEYYDFALLDIPADTPNYLRFAQEKDVNVGDEAKAIGNPMGLELSVSKGIISGVRTNSDLKQPYRIIPGETMSEREFEQITWVQTDTAMNPGNSGGPLLNNKNEIIGINTFVYRGQGLSGLNFALHVKHLRELVGHYYQEPRGRKRDRQRTR